jgi:hypothetical protein
MARRILRNSLLISLLAGNLVRETSSQLTASTTTQFTVCGEFLEVVGKARNWRVFVRPCGL